MIYFDIQSYTSIFLHPLEDAGRLFIFTCVFVCLGSAYPPRRCWGHVDISMCVCVSWSCIPPAKMLGMCTYLHHLHLCVYVHICICVCEQGRLCLCVWYMCVHLRKENSNIQESLRVSICMDICLCAYTCIYKPVPRRPLTKKITFRNTKWGIPPRRCWGQFGIHPEGIIQRSFESNNLH